MKRAVLILAALAVTSASTAAPVRTATENFVANKIAELKTEVDAKADKTTPYYAGNLAALTADGNLMDSGKKASDFVPAVDGGYLPLNGGTVGGSIFIGDMGFTTWLGFPGIGTLFFDGTPGGSDSLQITPGYDGLLYLRRGQMLDPSRELAVKGDISATNPTFSDAVLAVGLNIDTNSVAVLNEIAATFGGFPIGGTATTVGGLLAALAAAVAWLKKNKVQTLKLENGSVETSADGGVAKLDDFFTESNSLLTATIDSRLPYPLNAVTDETGLLKDRAINTTSLASVTVPDNFTDLLVRASVASSLSVTMPEAIATKYGDTFPGEAGEYLITITKTGAAEAYVRTIKLEEVANA